MKGRLLLSFDVEDFINFQSTQALVAILKLLEKYNLKGLFFVTGHMAEKLCSCQPVLDLLKCHEIGFHSSAHSVRPTIFEYCDVEKYEDAIQISIKRETSHINPTTGEIEKSGGICALRKLFPSKEILACRAPGYCCPPPYLEAMSKLGFKYDFSWNFSANPVSYKRITFYPRPIFLSCETALLGEKHKFNNWKKFLHSIFVAKTTVLSFHPNLFVNSGYWDSIYIAGNPAKLSAVPLMDVEKTQTMFTALEMLLRIISTLEKLGFITTSTELAESKTNLDLNKINLRDVADDLTFWPRTYFAYEPKYIFSQLSRFLDCTPKED